MATPESYRERIDRLRGQQEETERERAEREEWEKTAIYRVIINHEEQYSIVANDRPNPPGWNDVLKDGVVVTGLKQECLDYIEEVWTDMRPKSLREQMEREANEKG